MYDVGCVSLHLSVIITLKGCVPNVQPTEYVSIWECSVLEATGDLGYFTHLPLGYVHFRFGSAGILDNIACSLELSGSRPFYSQPYRYLISTVCGFWFSTLLFTTLPNQCMWFRPLWFSTLLFTTLPYLISTVCGFWFSTLLFTTLPNQCTCMWFRPLWFSTLLFTTLDLSGSRPFYSRPPI